MNNYEMLNESMFMDSLAYSPNKIQIAAYDDDKVSILDI